MKNLKNIFRPAKSLSRKDIKDYTEGNLSKSERRNIEHKESECELSADALDGFEEFGLEAMDSLPDEKEFLQKIGGRNTQPRLLTFNRIAATIVLMMIPLAGYFYLQENKTGDLYQAHFAEYDDPGLFAMRDSNSQQMDAVLVSGIDYYNDKEYIKAIPYFEQYLESHPEDERISFHLGLSFMYAGRMDDAKTGLRKIVLEGGTPYLLDAKWYLSLVHIKQGELEQATALLEEMKAGTDPYYSKKAISLLKELGG